MPIVCLQLISNSLKRLPLADHPYHIAILEDMVGVDTCQILLPLFYTHDEEPVSLSYPTLAESLAEEIGRASCRERV